MIKPMNTRKAVVVGALLPLLYFADASHDAPGLTLMRDAHAVVGAPATPGSVAGVARRTTRRTVAVASTAETPAAQPAPAAQQGAAAPRPAGAPAAGTVVHTLPAGCAAETMDGVEYQRCGGVSYRSAFQGNNLVYVAQ